MKKLMYIILTLAMTILPTLALAAGSVKAINSTGPHVNGDYECTVLLRGDASDGTVPDTTLATAGCSTLNGILVSVGVVTGSTRPTASFNVEFTEAAIGNTIDALQGAGHGLPAAGGVVIGPTVTISGNVFPAIRTISTDTTTIHVTGQSVPSAVWALIIKMADTQRP